MDKHKLLFITLLSITVLLIILIAGGIWFIKTQSNILSGSENLSETSRPTENGLQEKTELPPSPADKEKQRIESYEGEKKTKFP